MTLVVVPRNPVPLGAEAGIFAAADGTELRYARWRPPPRGSKGTVCVFGGRCEFIEKYFETVFDLRQHGYAVAIMDWRGQGGSARALANPFKGHVEDFSEYDSDLATFMSEIVLPDCPPPYYALAHSMGGNILLRAACLRDCWFERMLLCSPMIALAPRLLSPALMDALAQLGVFFGLGDMYVPGGSDRAEGTEPYEDNRLTSDRNRYERNQQVLETAPALGLGAPTIAWTRAAAASMKLINSPDFPAEVHVPLLMLAAGNDRIVSTRAIDGLASQLKSGSHIVINGARHELLQERNSVREQVWAAFKAFIAGAG